MGDVVNRLDAASEDHRLSETMLKPIENVGERVRQVGRDFTLLVESDVLDLPLPGKGETLRRWSVLSVIASNDLCVARLAEAHVDAIAILDELEGPPAPVGSRWGVWAAHPPTPALRARRVAGEWTLSGTKPFCSGANICSHALITADSPDGYRLFAVDLATGARARKGTWSAVGMSGSDSLEMEFRDVRAVAIGEPGSYLSRPGFWHGAIAVAACWYGGALGLARSLVRESNERDLGPHALAHLGAIDATLSVLKTSFDVNANEIDVDPCDVAGVGEIRALEMRAQTENSVLNILERVGRSLGARPLCHDARHATLAADLPVYVRQSHAEADLERLGSLVLKKGTTW